jgi:hypothetical protein
MATSYERRHLPDDLFFHRRGSGETTAAPAVFDFLLLESDPGTGTDLLLLESDPGTGTDGLLLESST